VRTRKFITNRLLARKQFVVEVLHPGRANVSKADLSEQLASQYKANKARVVVFGLRTQFGGGRSTGFGLIYDDEESQKRFEPRYRLVRVRAVGCRRRGSKLSVVRDAGRARCQGRPSDAQAPQGAQKPLKEGASSITVTHTSHRLYVRRSAGRPSRRLPSLRRRASRGCIEDGVAALAVITLAPRRVRRVSYGCMPSHHRHVAAMHMLCIPCSPSCSLVAIALRPLSMLPRGLTGYTSQSSTKTRQSFGPTPSDNIRQKLNFLWIMSGSSWYSSAETHICSPVSKTVSFLSRLLAFLNAFRPARMEPPIQVEYLRSGGAYILILTSLSASRFTSLRRRSPYPRYGGQAANESLVRFLAPRVRVLPPLSTMLENRFFRRSRSTRLIESTTT
jgi:ribosomal protein S24E